MPKVDLLKISWQRRHSLTRMRPGRYFDLMVSTQTGNRRQVLSDTLCVLKGMSLSTCV